MLNVFLSLIGLHSERISNDVLFINEEMSQETIQYYISGL